MYPINLLIKPASGNCNIRCKYCFYDDISNKREIKSYGNMSYETLEKIVEKSLSFSNEFCNFAFQGGEPTLVGLDFYKKFIQYINKYNKKQLKTTYAIQTNGILLDEKWAEFFYENNFLVGISLDGTKPIHDTNRIDNNLNGTYDLVIEKINLLKKYNVEYNILTVITSYVANNIKSIYKFYKKNGFVYQQYIPCLEPIGDSTIKEYSLTPKLYGKFLCDIFDLWYEDIKSEKFIYNRYFENIVGMIKGYPPEACGMFGQCFIQNVVEADGGVYPCDFYVSDKYYMGNILSDSFQALHNSKSSKNFVQNSYNVAKECLQCEWKNICRGGCKRNRDNNLDGELTLNHYCSSFKQFFKYAIDRLVTL